MTKPVIPSSSPLFLTEDPEFPLLQGKKRDSSRVKESFNALGVLSKTPLVSQTPIKKPITLLQEIDTRIADTCSHAVEEALHIERPKTVIGAALLLKLKAMELAHLAALPVTAALEGAKPLATRACNFHPDLKRVCDKLEQEHDRSSAVIREKIAAPLEEVTEISTDHIHKAVTSLPFSVSIATVYRGITEKPHDSSKVRLEDIRP
ncbi:MAG: hypothetical protein KBC64_00870 [Simkaniaceae bacterium]|nr:hypothetical protein [Simkaniaceae bacterium]